MAKELVCFETRVYNKSTAFTFLKGPRTQMQIKCEDQVHLRIRNETGDLLFEGDKRLKSGNEIYGKEFASLLERGSRIFVEASNPVRLEAAAEAQSFDAQEQSAGFQSSPELRSAIEHHAMKIAKTWLEEHGFNSLEDTSTTHSYDYTCRRGGSLYYVEVKGTQGSGKTVIVTANEVRHAQQHPKHSVAVIVSGIRVKAGYPSGGLPRIYFPWSVQPNSLKCLQYQWIASNR